MNDEEKVIKLKIIAELDHFFNQCADNDFKNLKSDNEEYTEDEMDDIESIFMRFRNVIAGTDWDGEKREYEAYEVR